ncbi:hypothetical protein V2W45_1334608 [Cenococcum geophilum]
MSLKNVIKAAEQKNIELVRVNKELNLVLTNYEIPIQSIKEILSILEISNKDIQEQKRDAFTLRIKAILLFGGINGAKGDLAKQSSSASGAGLSIKIGFATTNVLSSAKPSTGINPTSRVSNAKVSSAKRLTKSSSPAKAASSAKVGSSTNKSGANKPLFVSEEESFTKSPIKSGSTAKRVEFAKPSRPNGKKAKSVLPRQDALEPATRQTLTVPPPIRPSATAPTALKYYTLETIESVESNIDIDIDLNNLDS